MNNPRDLIQRLADCLEEVIEELVIPEYAHTEEERTDAALFLVKEARAYLAQPEPKYPSDDATGGRVRPCIFQHENML